MIQRIIGGACLTYGVLLALSPASNFRSPLFVYIFDLMPRAAWSVAFATVGALALIFAYPLTAAVLSGWLVFWLYFIGHAAVVGETPYSSVVPWLTIVAVNQYVVAVEHRYTKVA